MGAGTASVGTFQKREPTGPPFVPTSADNGLSVDPVTGRIVLGNDDPGIAATLLSNREIPLNGFNVSFSDLPSDTFADIRSNGFMRVHDAAFDRDTVMSKGSLQVRDQIGTGGPTISFINGFGPLSAIRKVVGLDMLVIESSNAVPSLTLESFDFFNIRVEIGDVNAQNNNTFLRIEDPTSLIQAFAEVNGNASSKILELNGVSEDFLFGDIDAVSTGLRVQVNGGTSQVRLGDTTTQVNGTTLILDDAVQTITVNRNFIATSTANIDAITANAEEQNVHIWNKIHTQDIGWFGRDSGTADLAIVSSLQGIRITPLATFDVTFVRGLLRFPGTTGNTLRWGANIAAPGTAVAGAVVNRYGGANNFLGDPTEWLLVNVNGTDRKIPCYAV